MGIGSMVRLPKFREESELRGDCWSSVLQYGMLGSVVSSG